MANKKSKGRKTRAQKIKAQTALKIAKYGYFIPDLDWKNLFKNLSKEKVIRIINELFDTSFDTTSNLEFIDTESSVVTGFDDKGYVRADIIAKISKKRRKNKGKKNTNNDPVETIIIEFQSTSNSIMGYRLFVYSLNNSDIKTIKGKVVCTPARCITIYTTFDKPLAGFDEVQIRNYNYKYMGHFKFKLSETPEYHTIKYPFINILAMLKEDLAELDNSELDIFKILYLYRFKKNKELLLTEDVQAAIEDARKIISKYSNKDYEILVAVFKKLVNDIEKVSKDNQKENPKYREVYEDMQTVDIYSNIEFLRKAKVEARAEGKAEGKAEGRAEGKAEGRAESKEKIARLEAELQTVRELYGYEPQDIGF